MHRIFYVHICIVDVEFYWNPSSSRLKNFHVLLCNCCHSLYVVVNPSVCLSSVVSLSVTFMRPTQAIEIFGNVSTPFGTLAIR